MSENYISYSQICKILNVDQNKPSYNPKSAKTLFKHIAQVNAVIGNKKKAEEIVNFAQIGEFGMLRMMYQ